MLRPDCKNCGKPADWVRTRCFENEDAEVWECNTPGCASRGLIICHTVTKPKRCPACAAYARLMCNLGMPEAVAACDHQPIA